jgi:putative FmdB family regulatory protein
MPIYEYRCDRGHTFEVMQRMSEDALTSCATCDAPVQRVFHPVAVHFKGSGFYTTDYAKKKTDGASDSSSKGEDKKTEKKDSKPADSSAKKSD